MPRIVRKQNPPAFRNYKKYKPFLRLDFESRCAYCHIPELRYGPSRNFTVDHFRPKSNPKFRKLICAYSNLYYVCQDCNSSKGSTWPQPKIQAQGFRFLDPCLDDLTDHWRVGPDGSLEPRTTEGEYMVARVQLNRAYLRCWRIEKSALLAQIEEVAGLASAMTGKPEHTVVGRLLAALERRLSREFGEFWIEV